MKSRRVSVVLLVVVLLAGCDAALTRDERLQIESPREGATVSLPLALEWSSTGVRTTDPGKPEPGGFYFAVFVDRAPLGPGEALVELVERECAVAGNGCATRSYFEQRGVFITDQLRLRIANVPVKTEHRKDAYLHTATIVLMDSHHRRVGEGAWTRTFRVSSG